MSEWIKTGPNGPFPPMDPKWGSRRRSATILILVPGKGYDFGWLEYQWVKSIRDLFARLHMARCAGADSDPVDQAAIQAIDLDHPDPALVEPFRWGRSVGIRESGQSCFELNEVSYYLEIPPCPK